MKTANKRLTSVFLIILMILSFVPASAFAEEESIFNETQTAPQTTKNVQQESVEENIIQDTESEINASDTEETGKTITKEDIAKEDKDIIAAERFIQAVNNIGDISLNSEMAILDALKAYESLSDLAKEMVTDAKAKLDEAMTVLVYLKAEEEKRLQSEERLTDVTEKLYYAQTVTKEEGLTAIEQAIISVEESYAALSDEEKLVLDERFILSGQPDYNTAITAIKATCEEWKKESDERIILPVKEMLLSIEGIKPEDGAEALENALNELTTMHSSLTDSQKSLLDESVGGYDKKLKELTNRLQAWKNAGDINTVISMLTEVSLLEKITPEHSELILDTKRAFDILSDKSGIDEQLIHKLDEAVVLLEKAESDKAAAEEVVILIGNIGEIPLEAENTLIEARNAYNALSDEQKEYVFNIDILISAEDTLVQLKTARSEAEIVTALIDSIGEVSLDSEDTILQASSAYDSLSDMGKAFVTNYDILLHAQKTINDIKAAKDVTDLISSIGDVNAQKIDVVQSIRDKYDHLSDEQKALVTNLDVLLSAEETLKDYIAARKVIRLIDKLPGKATFTKDVSIKNAYSAYDSLTDEQKALVTNSDKITSLYSSLRKMEKTLEEYISEYGSQCLYIEDTTGYISISATIDDFLTDKDKDLIAAGKTVIYTVTTVAEEFNYEDINMSLLPIESEEVPFSPFYYLSISRAVAKISDSGVISEESETAIHEIPGQMVIEMTISEDMQPEVTDITRIFTGLSSPLSDAGNFARIMDMDQNSNTMTFIASGSLNIVPSFIDIMNPVTGDDATIYIIFGLILILLAVVLIIRKKHSGK